MHIDLIANFSKNILHVFKFQLKLGLIQENKKILKSSQTFYVQTIVQKLITK